MESSPSRTPRAQGYGWILSGPQLYKLLGGRQSYTPEGLSDLVLEVLHERDLDMDYVFLNPTLNSLPKGDWAFLGLLEQLDYGGDVGIVPGTIDHEWVDNTGVESFGLRDAKPFRFTAEIDYPAE